MPNTNAQTIHQMGQAINSVVRQATGRDAVENIDMDFVTVAQNKTILSVSDSVPYLRRNTGGGVNIGNATLARGKIIGGSLAWNQKVEDGDFPEGTVLWNALNGTLSVADGIGSYSVQNVSVAEYATSLQQSISIPSGHKVIVTFDIKPAYSKRMLVYALNGAGNPSTGYKQVSGGLWNRFNGMINTGSGNVSTLQLALSCTSANGYSVNDVDQIKNVNCFDLTQMFGTTIADYIYSLEQANAGAGVAFFREFFPNDYYDYNTGELKSVEGLQSHKTTGDGWERTYPLDSSLILRGIPKLDSNNKLYYDGDEYSPDGTVMRKYRIITLDGSSDEDWSAQTGINSLYSFTDSTIPNVVATNVVPNIISDYLDVYSQTVLATYSSIYGIGIFTWGNQIVVRIENVTSLSELKTYLSAKPLTVVYELAEPTTEEAEPFADPQEVSANGTEQYVTNSIIPVGHETDYLELVEV